MASLISHIFSSSALLTLGLYHLISTVRNYIRSPRDFLAKPYHPFLLHHRFKYLQLYLLILFLLISVFHQTLISSFSDPLVKGRTPVHLFSSLQSAAVLFLFLTLALSLLISETTSLLPLPSDLFFLMASAAFALHFSVSNASSAVQISDLQAKCESVSAKISAVSAAMCLALACNPKLFVADLAFAASVCLQGLWVLQTGLSLYVERFIPEGCHRLLDVVSGIEGSTKCDLEESRLRAVALLDLVFVFHVMFVVVIVIVVFGSVAKAVGIRKFGSYEALPTSSLGEVNHVQMKALAGTQFTAIWVFFRSTGEEQDRAKEETLEVLRILEEHGLGENKFFGGNTVGFTDIALGWMPYWLGVLEDIVGIKMLEAHTFPRVYAWMESLKQAPIIKDLLPLRDDMFSYFKAKRDHHLSSSSHH